MLFVRVHQSFVYHRQQIGLQWFPLSFLNLLSLFSDRFHALHDALSFAHKQGSVYFIGKSLGFFQLNAVTSQNY